eukprot:UN01517
MQRPISCRSYPFLIFFHDFSHFKLQSVPTQDKSVDFSQIDFSKINLLQKSFFRYK